MRRLRYGAEAALTYVAYVFFRMMPVAAASHVGGWFMSRLGPRLGVSRVARKNIGFAFPEKTEAEKEIIIAGMWDNLGRVMGEYPHLHGMSARVELRGREHFESMRDSHKAAFLFGAHLANWEIPAIRKQTGLDIHIVYRKPNNPWVDRLLRYARSTGCVGQIEKGAGGTRQIVSALRSGGVVGMLVDQKLNEGISIPFFGRDAMTAPAIAHFALKFECPIYPMRIERLPGCRFRITAFPPIDTSDTGHKDDDVKRIMTDINRMLEGWIREAPAQWLWIHRRWPKPLYTEQAAVL